MPLTYTIIPDHNLVYVRYWGFAQLSDTLKVFGDYAADTAFRPDQKHLIDLSEITDFERSFVDLVSAQAAKADAILQSQAPTMMVYLAPTQVAQAMARSILKSWDGLDVTVGRTAQDMDEALSMLGLPARSYADLPFRNA